MSATVRVPASLQAELERRAAREGVSIDELVAVAVAEKLARLRDFDALSERASKGDRARFLEILRRDGGEAPREDDRIAEN